MDVRALQKPLKETYRTDETAGRISLVARGSQTQDWHTCSVEVGGQIQRAQAHAGVGGPGTAACSGDLLLAALAACAQITCQTLVAAMDLPVDSVDAVAEGDLDLRGTLGIDPGAKVGFERIRLSLELSAARASDRQLQELCEKTERYCVVLHTLQDPPAIEFTRTSPRNKQA
jgi:uncharacterized OsmC-like protein